jgi:hypothetical protein
MEMGWNPFIQLYKALMLLYPRRFRAEFGTEMQYIFSQMIGEAFERGPLPALDTLVRELFHIPLEALRQHLRLNANRLAWMGPATRGEILIALMFFILPSTYIFINSYVNNSTVMVWGLIGLIIIALMVIGFLKGFPRWSLPYLGLGLAAVSFVFVFEWAADLVTPAMMGRFGPIPRDASTRLLLQAFWAGLLWLSLLTFTATVLGFLALVRRFRPLLQSIKNDWTLVSYILYYGATFTLFLAHDQYRVDQPFALASAICLACGAWFYLQGTQTRQRILALLSGFSLAMLAALAGRWSFIPGNGDTAWPLAILLDPVRWPVAIWSVFDWGWIILILILPALPQIIKKRNKPPRITS